MRVKEFLPILSTIITEDYEVDNNFFNVIESILKDDVDENDISFLKRGFKKSIGDPIVGESYLPLTVVCLNNMSVAITSKKNFTKIIDIKTDIIYFEDGQYIMKERNKSKVLYSKLFLFDNEKDRNNALTMIMTRFNNVEYNMTEDKKYV